MIHSVKVRLSALLLAALLFLCALTGVTSSAAADETRDRGQYAETLLDGIFAYLKDRYGCADLQSLLDEGFSAKAPLGCDWYVFAISRYGKYDFAKYRSSLDFSIATMGRVLSGTEKQKIALLDLAMGCSVDGTRLTDTVGSQGIMSIVFGLHLINNNVKIPGYSADDLIRQLLELRLSDGGWAISGQYSDPDVTAMTVQALAPHYLSAAESNSDLSGELVPAVDEALVLLSSKQKADGGFSSYGAANAESSAQILVMLSSLGIDAGTDARFLKNGQSVIDALASYRLSDGSFSHVHGGESNTNATMQACYSLIAYLRFLHGETPLYDLSDVTAASDPLLTPGVTPSPSPAQPEGTITPAENPGSPTGSAPERNSGAPSSRSSETKIPAYRIYGTAGILLLSAAIAVVLFLRKRLTRRNTILLTAGAALLLLLIWFVRIQSPQEYYDSLKISEEDADGFVTVTIRCDTVAGLDDLPSDGILLKTVRIPFRDGDSVYSALAAAAAEGGLAIDIGGAGNSAYIRAIGPLREFAYGSLSGWMYYVNGEAPSESCSARRLSDGDVIEWRYTRDMGIDTESAP